MKKIFASAATLVLCMSTCIALAQQHPKDSRTAPTVTNQDSQPSADAPEIGIIELDLVTAGWSAKKDIMGKPVYNDQKQRIGKIDDIIITPDDAVSFAVIGAGGFLGIGKHDVVIPVENIKSQDGQYVLPGATKEALKKLPAFTYNRK